jgi:phage terminase large subunit
MEAALPGAATRRRSGIGPARVEARGAVARAVECRDEEVLVSGPAGTGKTIGLLWKLHACALKYPGMRALMARKTGTSLTASALVSFQRYVLGAGKFGVRFFGGSKLKPAQFEYPNGSVIVVSGMDKPDKILSTEYDLAYINEATELTLNDWESLTGRMRNGVMPYQQIIADCNPSTPSHWLYQRVKSGLTRIFYSQHTDTGLLG